MQPTGRRSVLLSIRTFHRNRRRRSCNRRQRHARGRDLGQCVGRPDAKATPHGCNLRTTCCADPWACCPSRGQCGLSLYGARLPRHSRLPDAPTITQRSPWRAASDCAALPGERLARHGPLFDSLTMVVLVHILAGWRCELAILRRIPRAASLGMLRTCADV